MNDEPEYRIGWEDSAEAVLDSFVCVCGRVLVDGDDERDARYVAHNGCGRPELETVECDRCPRVYRARWKGMTFREEI